ncbi:MAG: hypothetical protein KKA07_06375 [Bacteroidetes bacterium]|nr:hypothetical protein [Bacteroidota bacterium]MBU1718681.1 hypothetical protein [Bacteroidota bacterium]
MVDAEINNQMAEINGKLDLVLTYVDQQRLKTQEIEDLVKDLTIVGNDMFKATVDELDQQSVELDTEELRQLIIRLIKNVGNINMVVGSFESINDFTKDLMPILRGMAFDMIAKIEEYEQKGYFEIFKNLSQNIDKLLNVAVMLTKPEVINALERTTRVITSLGMDEKEDNKSLWKLYKELKKPEIRKSISYSLRVIQEIQKANTKSQIKSITN